jgi:hypothetical protein
VQFTVNAETHRKLRRAQDLLRHVIPNGDPAQIFDRALTLLVAELEKKKLAAATRPRPSGNARARGRHVPAAVKREVWKRAHNAYESERIFGPLWVRERAESNSWTRSRPS